MSLIEYLFWVVVAVAAHGLAGWLLYVLSMKAEKRYMNASREGRRLASKLWRWLHITLLIAFCLVGLDLAGMMVAGEW